MPDKPLRDLIILLPGITGSVLQKDGKDLWAISGQSVLSAVSSMGQNLKALRLKDGASSGDIVATRLMPDAHLVPGLVKIDGYSATANMIRSNFKVVPGSITEVGPANFIEFPYDWRLDNRVHARRLATLVDERLTLWQKYSGNPDARVLFIVHSMGGLIVRYYLEALEGWRKCRALISFGTPYRGSLNAVNYLANGYKKLFIDLTEAMRTFPSVYQLLPIYPALLQEGRYVRVAEAGELSGFSRVMTTDALAFHREIESHVKENLKSADYLTQGYVTLPVVGIRQPTMQSASVTAGRISVSAALPEGIDQLLADGDGTVPRASAIPIEMSTKQLSSFVSEQHGSLQCNPYVLADIQARLEQMQICGLEAIRGPTVLQTDIVRQAISVDVDDLYLPGEPVWLRARIEPQLSASQKLIAKIAPVNGIPNATLTRVQLSEPDADGWSVHVPSLTPGLYRLEVSATDPGAAGPIPVHSLFEIGG